MNELYLPLLILHAVSNAIWVGAVYMGAIVDWPAIQKMATNGKFPFRFIVNQGRNVFVMVYTGIISQIISGVGLALIKPPTDPMGTQLLTVKFIALSVMIVFTLHGTFSTWPKLQVSTDEEAFRHYRFYMYKAYCTFTCGLINTVLMVMLYMNIPA